MVASKTTNQRNQPVEDAAFAGDENSGSLTIDGNTSGENPTAQQFLLIDDWVRRSVDGDTEAFALLVRHFSQRVFNIIGSFFRRRDVIEDVAQEVFTRVYFSLGTFTRGRSFDAWIARITVNACYNHFRSERRHQEKRVMPSAETENEWYELQMIEAAHTLFLSDERRREAIDIAERLLAKLEPEDRLILMLLDRDGHSIQELSEILGWGKSKIKTRAFRARRVLRSLMKRLLLSAENARKRQAANYFETIEEQITTKH
ncbi:MAG: RNA polymerase sigma factor [Acidobacteriota bacterium]